MRKRKDSPKSEQKSQQRSATDDGSGSDDFRNVSQKALADASGLSAPLISRIYSSDSKQRRDNLTLRSLLKLQRGLNAVTGVEWTLDAIARQIAQ